jgi:hypothetical protein
MSSSAPSVSTRAVLNSTPANPHVESAFQARNIGMWSNKRTLVPVTMPFEKFLLPLKKSTSHSASPSADTADVTTAGGVRYLALPPQGQLSGPEEFERALLNAETSHRSLENSRTDLNDVIQSSSLLHSDVPV